MAMNNQLLAVVQHIEAERGVSREIVLTAIEQAICQAARRNREVTEDLRVVIDRKNLALHVYDTLVCSEDKRGGGFIPLARARAMFKDRDLKAGLVILHDQNSPVVRIAFRATRNVSELLSMPLFYTEVMFQGVPE